MKVVNKNLLTEISSNAFNSVRKRAMFNLHEDYQDSIQRMVNVLQPTTYLCPHKHIDPEKFEVFVIIQGELLVLMFDDEGEIINHIILSPKLGNYIAELPPAIYHTIIPLAVNTAVFECKEGPYAPLLDKNFAPWAPKEGEEGTLDFNKKILDKLGINFPEFI